MPLGVRRGVARGPRAVRASAVNGCSVEAVLSASGVPHVPRSERCRRTERTILDAEQELFVTSARWAPDSETVLTAAPPAVPAAALHDLFTRFEGQGREAAVALLRNCLTHPEASRIVRDEVLCDRVHAVAASIDADDAELRAGLVGACLMGLTMARYLLQVEPVASAARADVERLMEPVLRALTEP